MEVGDGIPRTEQLKSAFLENELCWSYALHNETTTFLTFQVTANR